MTSELRQRGPMAVADSRASSRPNSVAIIQVGRNTGAPCFCPSCQCAWKDIPMELKFCPECGVPVEKQTVTFINPPLNTDDAIRSRAPTTATAPAAAPATTSRNINREGPPRRGIFSSCVRCICRYTVCFWLGIPEDDEDEQQEIDIVRGLTLEQRQKRADARQKQRDNDPRNSIPLMIIRAILIIFFFLVLHEKVQKPYIDPWFRTTTDQKEDIRQQIIKQLCPNGPANCDLPDKLPFVDD